MFFGTPNQNPTSAGPGEDVVACHAPGYPWGTTPERGHFQCFSKENTENQGVYPQNDPKSAKIEKVSIPPREKYKGGIQVGLYLYCLCFFLAHLRVARCASSCAASTAGHSQISNFIPQHNTTHTHLFLSRYITTFLDASGSSPHHKAPSFSFALFTIPPYHFCRRLKFLHLACYLLAHNRVMRSKLRMGRLCL